jgi:putative endonuclease
MDVKFYFVYLLTNHDRTVLYTGVTNSLERRIWQHKNGVFAGFSKTHRCDRLVYIESYDRSPQPSRAKSRSKDGGAHGKTS